MKYYLIIITFLTFLLSVSSVTAQSFTKNGMYPDSTFLTNILWDTNAAKVTCGDNAAATWSGNDFLYGTLGDCQSSFNIVEVGGNPYNALTKTVTGAKIDGKTWTCCGFDGGKVKGSGILAIGNTIYVLGRNWDGRTGVGLVTSTDNARNFTFNPNQVKVKLGYPVFANAGKGYTNAKDGFIYIWGHGDEDSAYSGSTKMHMLRVPTDQILNKSAYQYYTPQGTWAQTDPGALDLLTKAGVVFDCGTVSGSPNKSKCDRSGITYNYALGRYLVWMSDWNGTDDFRNAGKGGFGIYESATPWDRTSWKTVWHTPTTTQGWNLDGIGDAGNFITKWMSSDGKQMYLAYGGTNSFTLRKATFEVNGVVPTIPPTSTNTPLPSTTSNILLGDANNDGKVDGIDFSIWLSNYSKTTSNGSRDGDFNRDSKVDGIDFTIWLVNYGRVITTPSQQPSNTPTAQITPSPPVSPTTTSQPSVIPTSSDSSTININTSANLGSVNPLLWGINGPQKETRWNDGPARTNAIARIRDAKIKLVRIGPWQTAKHANGTTICTSPSNCNFTVIDQYVSAITEAGAEPLFLVNGYPGGIVERDWNAYATFMRTVVRRYPQVKYWQMWNEPPGEPDGVIATFEEYKNFVNIVGGAMKAERPDIKLGGPTEAHEGNNWTKLSAAQLPLLDTIIWHDYADPGDNQAIMDDVCPSYYDRPVARRAEFGKGVAITEWNMNWGAGGTTHHNHYNATRIVSAIIGATRARMDYFTLFNLAGGNLLSMTTGGPNFSPLVAYYAFYIMGNYTGDTILSANSCGINKLDHIATKRGNTLFVTVANRNVTASQSISIQVSGATNGNYTRRIIDSTTTTSNNPQTNSVSGNYSNGTINYTLPASSVANFIITI